MSYSRPAFAANLVKSTIYDCEVINFKADRKRLWLGQLGKIDDQFNDSAPISFNQFRKNEI